MNTKDRCIMFLEQNGWKCDTDDPSSEEYMSYIRDGYLGVDICQDGIVLIAEVGDINEIPLNYYALVGLLMEYRQIDCGYTSIK